MNTVDWMRRFKNAIIARVEGKTGWGKIDLKDLIEDVYREMLESMINQEEKNV